MLANIDVNSLCALSWGGMAMPFAASVVEYFRLQNLERVLVEANPLSEA